MSSCHHGLLKAPPKPPFSVVREPPVFNINLSVGGGIYLEWIVTCFEPSQQAYSAQICVSSTISQIFGADKFHSFFYLYILLRYIIYMQESVPKNAVYSFLL